MGRDQKGTGDGSHREGSGDAVPIVRRARAKQGWRVSGEAAKGKRIPWLPVACSAATLARFPSTLEQSGNTRSRGRGC